MLDRIWISARGATCAVGGKDAMAADTGRGRPPRPTSVHPGELIALPMKSPRSGGAGANPEPRVCPSTSSLSALERRDSSAEFLSGRAQNREPHPPEASSKGEHGEEGQRAAAQLAPEIALRVAFRVESHLIPTSLCFHGLCPQSIFCRILELRKVPSNHRYFNTKKDNGVIAIGRTPSR
jgi:hypothetical protein